MWNLKYALESTAMKPYNKCIYIKDNASIHHSYSTLEVFKKLNLWIMYLPAYSPELLFRLIKNKIRSWQAKPRIFILKSKR